MNIEHALQSGVYMILATIILYLFWNSLFWVIKKIKKAIKFFTFLHERRRKKGLEGRIFGPQITKKDLGNFNHPWYKIS